MTLLGRNGRRLIEPALLAEHDSTQMAKFWATIWLVSPTGFSDSECKRTTMTSNSLLNEGADGPPYKVHRLSPSFAGGILCK